MPNEEIELTRTPSETLISCLEDFGDDEPDNVLVIYTTKGGDICWSANGPYKYSVMIGMLICVKHLMLKKFD